jgi:hypothetical protein
MIKIPLTNGDFTLDSASLAGFFGGAEAVSAMGTVHMYPGRKWMGWYNSPGSYTIAQKYGQLANSRLWDGLFPGPDVDPAVFFGFDGKQGPEFFAVHSGTRRKTTGHLGALFLRAAERTKVAVVDYGQTPPRKTNPINLTIVDLSNRKSMINQRPTGAPLGVVDLESQGGNKEVTGFRGWILRRSTHTFHKDQDLQSPVQQKKLTPYRILLGCIPILISVGACVACALFEDWYCFAMVLVGMLSNGMSCFILGSGELRWQKPRASAGSPPGDGVFLGDSDVMIVLGDENQVQFLTMGKFVLHYDGSPVNTAIGASSLLLYVQFLAQLLLIPQGKLIGQIIFLSTLAVSWAYNCYLSSLEKEKRQISRLLKELGEPKFTKFEAGTRTTLVVLVLLVLAEKLRNSRNHASAEELLDKLIPNNTPTWKDWKTNILRKLANDGKITRHTGTNSDKLVQDLNNDAYSASQIYDEYTRVRRLNRETQSTSTRRTSRNSPSKEEENWEMVKRSP